MDINGLRSLVTVTGFIGFVGILVWAWMPSRKKYFDEAALLPFEHDQDRPL